jgi:hypothetical protein
MAYLSVIFNQKESLQPLLQVAKTWRTRLLDSRGPARERGREESTRSLSTGEVASCHSN